MSAESIVPDLGNAGKIHRVKGDPIGYRPYRRAVFAVDYAANRLKIWIALADGQLLQLGAALRPGGIAKAAALQVIGVYFRIFPIEALQPGREVNGFQILAVPECCVFNGGHTVRQDQLRNAAAACAVLCTHFFQFLVRMAAAAECTAPDDLYWRCSYRIRNLHHAGLTWVTACNYSIIIIQLDRIVETILLSVQPHFRRCFCLHTGQGNAKCAHCQKACQNFSCCLMHKTSLLVHMYKISMEAS